MKYKILSFILLIAEIVIFGSCRQNVWQETRVRQVVDTVGFAHQEWQMDSIMARIERSEEQDPERSFFQYKGTPKVIIAPHDDYTYVGSLYPAALKNIKAKTIILFGVAHKARLLNLEDQIIFDSYDYWKAPYGNVKVSDIRDEIIEQLPTQLYQVNDSMQQMEHSLEALIPFLQYYNRDVQIVPILVPYMSYEKMQEIAKPLSAAIQNLTTDKGLVWGKDFAIVITTDAVHYGDEDWGGMNFAEYGTDSAGYAQAIDHEYEIMNVLSGKLQTEKLKTFCNYTVENDDYKKYKWTWCGRYSVPMGLLTSFLLNEDTGGNPLTGSIIGYSNSIDHPEIKVDDLGMGKTAPANMHHWVGYAALGYK